MSAFEIKTGSDVVRTGVVAGEAKTRTQGVGSDLDFNFWYFDDRGKASKCPVLRLGEDFHSPHGQRGSAF